MLVAICGLTVTLVLHIFKEINMTKQLKINTLQAYQNSEQYSVGEMCLYGGYPVYVNTALSQGVAGTASNFTAISPVPIELAASATSQQLSANTIYLIPRLYTGALTLALPSGAAVGSTIVIRDAITITTDTGSGIQALTSLTVTSDIIQTPTGGTSVNWKRTPTYDIPSLVGGGELIFTRTTSSWFVSARYGKEICNKTRIVNPTNAYAFTEIDNSAVAANQIRTFVLPNANVNLGDLPTVATTNSNILSGLNSGIVSGGSNTIAGMYSFIGGGTSNVVSSHFGVIAGGSGNNIYAATTAFYSFIGGGNNNKINQNAYTATSDYSVIVGGLNNRVDGMCSSILGGQSNTINTSISDAHNAIVGGFSNTITGRKSTIVGGQSNNIFGFASSILSGVGNTITFNGDRSAIIAGGSNQADAAGQIILTGGTATKVSAQYSTTIAANTTSVVRGGGYKTVQVLQGATSTATTIYLDVNGINSTSQITTSAVPHTALSGATGEYKLARHTIVVEIAGQSFGSCAFGTIISRWKNVDGTFTKLGTDTYTVEYEGGTVAGLINNMVISNNSGRLQIAAVSASAEIIVWRAFVTSDYS